MTEQMNHLVLNHYSSRVGK